MSRFNSELVREEFKDFCTKVLPAIRNIERTLEKTGVTEGISVRISQNGYMTFDIYDSNWRMARYKKDGPVKMIYECSEEISVPEGRVFDKVSENLVEISLVFASLQSEITDGQEIDSITWKQMFVQWANEFEDEYPELNHWENANYFDCITKFAKEKIFKFSGIDN